MPLTQWFLAFYFVSQDKRGISAVALMSMLGTTYKTAWYMLVRIRAAMGQRDKTHRINGTIEFDDTYVGGPTVGKKWGWGTKKAKVFVAMSLDKRGNPLYTKMQVTQNIKRSSVKKFVQAAFVQGSTICSETLRSQFGSAPLAAHRDQQRQGVHPGYLPWSAQEVPPSLP